MTATTHVAQAGGGWLPSGTMAPIEQRVAVASGANRSALWTSLRFEAAAGPVGVVIPVPVGAFLDHSSDAWLEALEVATAPRVLPPEGVTLQCPGQDPSSEHPFHVAGRIDHQQSLVPDEQSVLADVASVKAWAQAHAFVLSPEVSAALDAMSGMQFVVERFSASGGEAVTPTVRVVMPGIAPVLPLTLTQAADKDLLVTTWLLGTGRAALTGTALAALDPSVLTWNAGAEDSSYFDARREALLAAGSGSALLESSNHEALSHNLAIAGATASIDGVIKTFFERAAAYGDGDPAPAACVAQAAAALASAAPIGLGCPRADLGVVGGMGTCMESPMPGQTDPQALRCGPGADDLAVALSGLSGSAAWLSRWSMILSPHATGAALPVTFAPGPEVDVVLSAQSVDLGDCTDAGADAGQSSSSSSSSSSSTGGSHGSSAATTTTGAGMYTTGAGSSYDPVPPSPEIGCGCSGTADTSDWGEGGADSSGAGGETSDGSGNDYGGDDCSSDTSSSSSGDDCGGDTTGETSYGDDCDTTDTSGSSGDDCDTGGDPGAGDSCDGGDSYGGDDCAGDASSTDACSGGDAMDDMSCDSGSSSGDCAIASSRVSKPAKKRMPKLSAMTLGALAFLIPLRRARRPRRQRTSAVKP